MSISAMSSKLSDLNYPNLEILDPHRSMVVSVVSSRVAMKDMEVPKKALKVLLLKVKLLKAKLLKAKPLRKMLLNDHFKWLDQF